MKVKELIKKLQEMPQDEEVFIVYDGEPRINLSVVWQSKKGPVIVTGFSQVVENCQAILLIGWVKKLEFHA